jgi:hypothetical protein
MADSELEGGIVRKDGKNLRLLVRVQPRSSRSGIEGIRDGALRIAVHAPPDKGAANEELIKVLAKALGLPKSTFEIVAGGKSRNKEIRIVTDQTSPEIMDRLMSGR